MSRFLLVKEKSREASGLWWRLRSFRSRTNFDAGPAAADESGIDKRRDKVSSPLTACPNYHNPILTLGNRSKKLITDIKQASKKRIPQDEVCESEKWVQGDKYSIPSNISPDDPERVISRTSWDVG